MIRVGVVGLGMMGLTHLNVYRRRDDVKIVAICDRDPKRLAGEEQAAGNLEGQAQANIADLPDVLRLSDAFEVIGNPDIDLVDICLPTDMHARFGAEVLKAGQHLMIEKPLARTSAEAQQLVDVAKSSSGIAFVGHCMRFWPGWTWLKEVVDRSEFGRVYSAEFFRLVNHPGGEFYLNGDRSGGAALDLHIHDTDFVQFLFGMPEAVTSFGYSKLTNQPDHILTRYSYKDLPLVTAEGSWAMADGYAFRMGYTVNFENATAVFDSSRENPLTLCRAGNAEPIPVEATMGYDLEIDYMLNCIKQGTKPTIVTIEDGLRTLQIVEAETQSVQTGHPVAIGR